MHYIEQEEILLIHNRIVDVIRGRQGVRDVNLLQSITQRPRTAIFGKEQFPTLFEKAAVYLQSIAQYHVFTDGNKRTSIAVAARFLYKNGYELETSNAEVVMFVLKVVEEKLGIPEIVVWFKQNTKAIS